jgi:hypothetical protein
MKHIELKRKTMMGKYSVNAKKHRITSTVHELGDFNITYQQVDPKTYKIDTPRMLTHITVSTDNPKAIREKVLRTAKVAYSWLDRNK